MKNNIIWGVFLALVALFCCVAMRYSENITSSYSLARVMQDGVTIREIDLSTVDAPYEFEVSSTYGSNTISVQRGKIAVTEADCHDKICVKTGYISTGATPIVCLPHKLTISIVGNDEIDAVAGNH